MSRFSLVHSDADIIAELKAIADLVPDGPILQRHLNGRGGPRLRTILRRYGSWHAALSAAGLEDRYSGTTVSKKMRTHPAAGLSDDEVIAELRRIATELDGKRTNQIQVANLSPILSVYTLRDRPWHDDHRPGPCSCREGAA